MQCINIMSSHNYIKIFSFGLLPGAQLHVPSPLPANQTSETSLLLNTSKKILNFILVVI